MNTPSQPQRGQSNPLVQVSETAFQLEVDERDPDPVSTFHVAARSAFGITGGIIALTETVEDLIRSAAGKVMTVSLNSGMFNVAVK